VRRAILMGDPTHWSARAGAASGARPGLGALRSGDRAAAIRQWRALYAVLRDLGAAPIVIPPHVAEPGLVYPANAGFLTDLDAEKPVSEKRFVLANPRPVRPGERLQIRQVLAQHGFRIEAVDERLHFAGSADFFAAGDDYVFTVGCSEPSRRRRIALPPWRRIPGRRADAAAEPALRALVAPKPVLRIELAPEAQGHGDTVLCAFGPGRRQLLVHSRALAAQSLALLREIFRERVLELSDDDAALGAANAFALNQGGECFLVLPAGVSPSLRAGVRERGATPVAVDVSAFRASGAVKRLIADLGPVPDDRVPLRGRPEGPEPEGRPAAALAARPG
jgi:N-dimethylarginine dimethylaminohydrolase